MPLLIILLLTALATLTGNGNATATDNIHKQNLLRCCYTESYRCKDNATWTPPQGFSLIDGVPQCGPRSLWPVFHQPKSLDRLYLLPQGILRHIALNHAEQQVDLEENEYAGALYVDYKPGQFCLDRVINEEKRLQVNYAVICAPDVKGSQINGTTHLWRHILDPAGHALNIACLLSVAVIYFVIPALRDLVGNILTTMAMCMLASQAAELVASVTRFSAHVSLVAADIVAYSALMAAAFWLNTMGYYIWRTFRSRNVFLRVTDGRKYCYYSTYSWCCTAVMTAVAVFAHYILESGQRKPTDSSIGWLGVSVIFTAVGFTILVNIYFYVTTGHAISRMSTYGRIHHKMKYSFEMFVQLFLVLCISWLFKGLSRLPYDALFYCYVVVNALLGPLVVYVVICNQHRVTSQLRALCCCPCCKASEVDDSPEWGEELTRMTGVGGMTVTQC
ncbi:probable G-protein coupled receptor Mth-like 5 isoform X1 [Schistocerca cancellata]|uniref:probable G-protein coupled receptor Mth-like 5 isoform X1 n=1 Tax=Schistocerca cancellata TaxID=274614 RepID=UPI002117862E|nr:probable G-protein coupled receptor Mth-like 5 isoform X1 [Schistocerca cancellata]